MLKIIQLNMFLIILILKLLYVVNCRTYSVSTSIQLLNAINKVKAGDEIHLNSTVFKGTFRTERSGSPNAMIILQGTPQSVISNKEGVGFHLRKANYWHFKGFLINNSRKGMIFEKSNHNIVENIKIENIDEEGIHIYDESTDNIIRESDIQTTGIRSYSHGEAIVIGRDFRHWFGGRPDQSDRNIVINNRLGPGFSTEAVVLNEGTCCGLLAGNYFDGHGMSDRNGYGCWVKIKGDRYRIVHNNGKATVSEGFMVIKPKPSIGLMKSDLTLEMGGCENIFEQNSCHLKSNGYCIKVVDNKNKCGNVVYSDNEYSDGLALTNIPITRRKRSYKLSFITDEVNFPLIFAFTFLPFVCLILSLILCFTPRPTNNSWLKK